MLIERLAHLMVNGQTEGLPLASAEDMDAWPGVLETRAADVSVTCLIQDDMEHPADKTFLWGPLDSDPFRRWWIDLCTAHQFQFAEEMGMRVRRSPQRSGR
jgi:hypothetical protein